MLKAQLRGDGGMLNQDNFGLDKQRTGQFPGTQQNLGFVSAYPPGQFPSGSSQMSLPGAFGGRGGTSNPNPYDTMYSTMTANNNNNNYGGNKRRAAGHQQQQNSDRNQNRLGRRLSRKGKNNPIFIYFKHSIKPTVLIGRSQS
jgi:hypothetical protein